MKRQSAETASLEWIGAFEGADFIVLQALSRL